jgi:hypothetical protein
VLSQLIAAARSWCAGKAWPPRLALLLVLAYPSLRVLHDPSEHVGLFGGLTLAIHEGGHILWSPFGEWMGVAGGSLTQLLGPLVCSVLLVRTQDDYFGGAILGLWLSDSMATLSVYVADARAQALDLVSIGSGDPLHDWNYLLGRAGLLGQDQHLAGLLHLASWGVFLATLAACAWMLLLMRASPEAEDAVLPV